MRILFLSMTVPYPPTDGGRIRVLNLLKQVAKTNEITFQGLETTPTDGEGIAHLRTLGIDAHLVPYQHDPPPIGPKTVINAVIHRKPVTVARYDLASFRQRVEAMCDNRQFDLIHYEMFHAAQYFTPRPIPALLSQQNVDSYIWQRLCEQTHRPLRKLLYKTQQRAFLSYERVMSPKFDAVTVASELDRDILEAICPLQSIAVIPNGVDVELYQPDHALEEPASLIYTGSLDWHPNADAVCYFADEIFPRIQAEMPNVKFYVVGKSPAAAVRNLAQRPGIIVTGAVPEIRPYIARATVYVVPLRIGSGTRLKILEALGMEKAVVSTSIGAEGLHLVDKAELLIADDPAHFANAVVALLSDKQKRRYIGRHGRQRVEANYDWKQIGAKLHQVYEEAAMSDEL